MKDKTKNILLITMLILSTMLMCYEGYSQENDNELHPIMGFEVGYNIYNGTMLTSPYNQMLWEQNNTLSIQMTSGLRYNNLTILGTYTNLLSQERIDNYLPLQDTFRIDIMYQLGDFTIGFTHWCSHSVVTAQTINNTVNDSVNRRIYIKYYKEF